MCVVSMIMDHYWDKWSQPQKPNPPDPIYISIPVVLPTQAEIDEFHKLLERAREYDKRNNEPDCELSEKKERLQKLADELGITIKIE